MSVMETKYPTPDISSSITIPITFWIWKVEISIFSNRSVEHSNVLLKKRYQSILTYFSYHKIHIFWTIWLMTQATYIYRTWLSQVWYGIDNGQWFEALILKLMIVSYLWYNQQTKGMSYNISTNMNSFSVTHQVLYSLEYKISVQMSKH